MHLPIQKRQGENWGGVRGGGGQETGERKRCGRGKSRGAVGWQGAVRCCQTSRRSLHSCRSQAHCASCRAFLLPRSCEGTSATCAAPETVCPARRCWGWSSAWLGACPCCWGGDKQNTCREQAHIWEKHAGNTSFISCLSFTRLSFLSHASHAITG